MSSDERKGAKAVKSKESKQQTVYTVATKQLLISFAPPVLTLHLKRFQQARFTLRKLTKHVDFPLELNLAPFCSKSGRVSRKVGYVSVYLDSHINKKGTSIRGGGGGVKMALTSNSHRPERK